MSDNNELVKTSTEQQAMQAYDPNVAYGFEDVKPEDVIIPRLKVINAMSPERQEGKAEEGSIINSLTMEPIAPTAKFVPIKMYYSCIRWNPDRQADPRIFCRSFDGKIGENEDGTLACSTCGRNKFDNSKSGKAAQPECTNYINFMGFLDDNPMPVVLSFSRTNYNEGKKLLSIARSMRAAIWNYAYTIGSVKVAKDRNQWFNIQVQMAGETTPEQRALAFELFKAYEHAQLKVDYEDAGSGETNTEPDQRVAAEI